jgi:hypothetical protein
MRGRRCWQRPPPSWRGGGSDRRHTKPQGWEGSALSTRVIAIATAAATTTAGTAGLEVVTAAITAILPAAGAGTATLTAAAPAAAVTTAAAVATTTAAIAAAAAPVATATATAAAAVATAATAAVAATTTAAATAWLGLVDAKGAAHQLGPLQALDGPVLGVTVRHLDEGETALATGVALQGKGAVHDLAKGGEELTHVFLLGAEGKIANKNTHGPTRNRTNAMASGTLQD